MAESEGLTHPLAPEHGEASLLLGLREREPEACQELCSRFGPKIHAFVAARLSGDGQLAEDLMVETLADAARNITRFNPGRSTLSAWLFGIARRKIQGELRRQRRLKSVPASAQVSLETMSEASLQADLADALASRLDARQRVAELSTILSELEFDVLVLNCVDELSAREIGRIVGRSERAIHSLLHRARNKARERLVRDED